MDRQDVDFSTADPRLWHYRAKVSKVLRGDSLIALIDLGFCSFRVERLQLAGVEAPVDRALADKARRRLVELVEGREVLIRTERTAKLGRWLATIDLDGDRRLTVNRVLLDEGLVRVYTGRPDSP